jgi:hypothetical protein
MSMTDMIDVLPPLEKYKYDTWRILPVKCYIDNSVHIRNVTTLECGNPSHHCLTLLLHKRDTHNQHDNSYIG